jgi:hypothetical protein
MLPCFIILIAAIGPFVGAWVVTRLAVALERRDLAQGTCLACGYDRKGLAATELCPECGLNAAGAIPKLLHRSWICTILPLGLGAALCVLFILLGQPLTPGEEAWACTGVLVPLAILAFLTWLPRFGRRTWIRWILLVPTLAALLAVMTPAYLNLAMNQTPGEYGRGFGLQLVPLAVGVICVGLAGWGTAISCLILAARLRAPLTRPDTWSPSPDGRALYVSPW